MQAQLRFALDWLDCHVRLSRQLGKPLVLSEWGKRRQRQLEPGAGAPAAAGDGSRADFFEQVRRWMEGGRRRCEWLLALLGTAKPGIFCDWLKCQPSYQPGSQSALLPSLKVR